MIKSLIRPAQFGLEMRAYVFSADQRPSLSFVYESRLSKMNFLTVKESYFTNFDFENGCKNGFKDYNEKSCS